MTTQARLNLRYDTLRWWRLTCCAVSSNCISAARQCPATATASPPVRTSCSFSSSESSPFPAVLGLVLEVSLPSMVRCASFDAVSLSPRVILSTVDVSASRDASELSVPVDFSSPLMSFLLPPCAVASPSPSMCPLGTFLPVLVSTACTYQGVE